MTDTDRDTDAARPDKNHNCTNAHLVRAHSRHAAQRLVIELQLADLRGETLHT